jgi:anion-transporting  ArsA/GET3 family ATPase
MASLLERKLIVVTGKGGTGKSTVACALGLIAAGRGLRTIVVEVGDQRHIADLFGAESSREDHHGDEIELQQNLWSTSLDPDRAMIEWLQTLTGRISARLLASSSTFQYFAAAAPGAKELVSMIKVRELCAGRAYDLVVLDAPATGHALAMLRSPQTFAAIVRVGPLADQAVRVRELLADPRRTGYMAAAHATEMAVTETLELEQGLRRGLDRDLDAIVVNGTAPRRFTRTELERIAQLDVELLAECDSDAQVLRGATQMALAVHERARVQQNQIARLRRLRFAPATQPGVLTIPLAFTRELDLQGVREISAQLERKL